MRPLRTRKLKDLYKYINIFTIVWLVFKFGGGRDFARQPVRALAYSLVAREGR